MRGRVEPLDVGNIQVPHHFRCPISLDLMTDPVTVSTGQTYDRSSIESWIATGNSTCPVTRAPLTDLHVIPNHTLRRLIQQWCISHRSSGVQRVPTPTHPPDPVTVQALLAQAASESTARSIRLSALSRLRRLGAESDKNREVIASQDAAGILTPVMFGSACELSHESLAVISMLSLSETECVYVASDPDRIGYLVSLLFDDSMEVRVNSAAVIDMVITGTRSSELRANITESDDVYEGVVRIINSPFSHPRALRIGFRTLLALCLVRAHRHKAVTAGAVPALIEKITDLEKYDAERALGAVELLCRSPSGCAAFAVHALTVPLLAKAVLRVSDRATEFASGALLAVCGADENCRREAVAAGAVMRMLLVVQSECTERAKRKAQALLKLLRDSWPKHCHVGGSDEYYGCSDVVLF